MSKRTLAAALSACLFSAGAQALLIEGSFTAETSSQFEKTKTLSGNILIDYDPARVTIAGTTAYSGHFNWVDISINEFQMPFLDEAQAPEILDQVVLRKNSGLTGDSFELVDKASDTTELNTELLRRVELSFQLESFHFLSSESIGQPFNLDWSSPDGAGQLKIFHRTPFAESIGTKTNYKLTSLRLDSQPGPIATVPEPASLMLLSLGLAAIGLKRRSFSRLTG